MTAVKNQKFEQLVQPIYFYCTLKGTAGIERALELGELRFMDGKHKVPILQARTPSDLLWLNRDVSKRSARIGGTVMAVIILFLTVICGYAFVVELSVQVYVMLRINPPSADCSVISNVYDEEQMV